MLVHSHELMSMSCFKRSKATASACQTHVMNSASLACQFAHIVRPEGCRLGHRILSFVKQSHPAKRANACAVIPDIVAASLWQYSRRTWSRSPTARVMPDTATATLSSSTAACVARNAMCVAASRSSFAPRRSPASIASAWARRFVDAVGPVAVERALGVHAGDGVALDAVAEVRVA
jgi:hypothetical protein